MRLVLTFIIGLITIIGCVVGPAYVVNYISFAGIDFIVFLLVLLIGSIAGIFSSLPQPQKKKKNDTPSKKSETTDSRAEKSPSSSIAK